MILRELLSIRVKLFYYSKMEFIGNLARNSLLSEVRNKPMEIFSGCDKNTLRTSSKLLLKN
jgi:hypothetical protein